MRVEMESQLRQQIVDQCKWLSLHNFNQVTSGNISVRLPLDPLVARSNSLEWGADNPSLTTRHSHSGAARSEYFLITPSGQNYATLTPEMLVKINLEGHWEGDYLPSSEWRFHVDIMKRRPDINAVVHTHSMFATIQSMTRQAIPACHYLIALLGGSDVRCAPYARFGSQELSDYAVAALDGRMACMLSNHGAIAVGRNLQQAVDNAVLLETLSQQYYYAKIAGVCLLTDQEITETQQALDQLPTYGHR